MISTPLQASFTSGELSPRTLGRIDLESYYTGAAKLDNFICLPHGPLLRRAGTTFINQAKSSEVRLVPFTFNVSQSFIIEFGDRYARFYFSGGIITSSGDTPYEISTPWSIKQVKEFNWAQSGDILYIVHPDVQPTKLKRLGNTNWQTETVSFTNKPANWSSNNWPSCVVFHEQRLYYAATPNLPQTVWGSRIGLFDDFTIKDTGDPDKPDGEVLDDMGFEYTIASDDVNGIKWLKAMDILAVGTSGAEYKISASSAYEAITPKNIRITRQTSYGSAPVRPQQIGSGIAFVQRSRNRVRQYEFLWTENQYAATDLTVLSEHIARAGIESMALQTAKDTYLWCTLKDGSLIALTYEKQQKVVAWHAHHLGGNGKVRALAIIPGVEADQVWVAVERVINGKTVLYIETFLDAFSEEYNIEECRYVDSSLSYIGDTAISRVGGLDHLEGQEVAILVDGWVHPNETVTNGYVDLQSAGKHITIGLPYSSILETCPVQTQEAVTAGRPRRITHISLSLLLSLGFDFGIVGQHMETQYMGPTKIMNKAQPLFTGVLDCQVPMSSDKQVQVRVEQHLPLPCIIRNIKYNMEVH